MTISKRSARGDRGRTTLNALIIVACAAMAAAIVSGGITHADPKLLWVQVKEDSPDSVLLAEPSRWADPVATLPFNAQVEVLGDLSTRDDQPLPYYQVKYRGDSGFIKRSALAEESPMQVDAEDTAMLTATGAGAANNAAKGLNRSTDNGLQEHDPEYKEAVAKVDQLEARVGKSFYGRNNKDEIGDPGIALKKYRAFGESGGLLPKGAK
jgi:hypothetical protein